MMGSRGFPTHGSGWKRNRVAERRLEAGGYDPARETPPESGNKNHSHPCKREQRIGLGSHPFNISKTIRLRLWRGRISVFFHAVVHSSRAGFPVPHAGFTGLSSPVSLNGRLESRPNPQTGKSALQAARAACQHSASCAPLKPQPAGPMLDPVNRPRYGHGVAGRQ